MKERLFHVEDALAVLAGIEPAVDAQGLAYSGDEEQEGGAGIGGGSRAVGDGDPDGRRGGDVGEGGGTADGPDAGPAVGIGVAEEAEAGEAGERSAVFVELGDRFEERGQEPAADGRFEVLDGCDRSHSAPLVGRKAILKS